ncbi:hypothetical protein [Edaphobacter aggregans]|uniref:hypothetical protein n=1 Tax=Edaphobacter aggregans TaxID=570835 RepID=UPI00054DFF95|nr:hypothetical protein [Edaphobacter aggregans]
MLEAKLVDYLTAIVGDRPWLEPARRESLTKLPLFLREKYQILRADLFGRKAFLAIQNNPDTSEPSPTEYAQDIERLRKVLFEDVILVIENVPSYVRNRMVQRHLPFIVPGTQMFLPMLMIDLREQYPRRSTHPKDRLSPVAQVVVLYHLLRNPLDNIPLNRIATELHYSAMAISKAHEELQSTGICEVERAGKSLFLRFKGNKTDVWHDAEPSLATPVRRTEWARWGANAGAGAVEAGLTALSSYTMLTDESIPTFAMRDKHLVEALRRGDLFGSPNREDAEVRMESWSYDPMLLSENRQVADPCSVYLSLRSSADERIQKELNTLIDSALR